MFTSSSCHCYWNSSPYKLNVLFKDKPAKNTLNTWLYIAKYTEIYIKYMNKVKQPRPQSLWWYLPLSASKAPGTRDFSSGDDSDMTHFSGD